MWSLDDEQLGNITTDTFTPSVTKKDIGKRYVKWKRAVERSMKWETPVSDLASTGDSIMTSLPASLFIVSTVGLILLTEILDKR